MKTKTLHSLSLFLFLSQVATATMLNPSRNLIINGNMNFFQRGTSTTSSGVYAADRFKSSYSGGTLTYAQSTSVPTGWGGQYSLSVTATAGVASPTAGQFATFYYPMEGQDFAPIYNHPFTLSFWVKDAVTGTHCVAFQNSAQTRSYVATYSVSTANTWQQASVTVNGVDTTGAWNFDNTLGLYIQWTLFTGSTYQAASTNAWVTGNFQGASSCVNSMATTGNVFAITGVSLVEGSIPRPFALAGGTIAGEAQFVGRYYQKTFPPGVAPAQNAGTSGSISFLSPNGTNAAVDVPWWFTINMRTAPTVVTYDPSAADANWGPNPSSPTASTQRLQPNGVIIRASSTNQSVGNIYTIHATADADF